MPEQSMLVTALWFLASVATDMVAISALVKSHGFRRLPWGGLSLASVFVSFYCIRKVILVIPLAVTYALWCVFGIVGTLLIGRFLFKQRISMRKYVGIFLLTLGVLCMTLA